MLPGNSWHISFDNRHPIYKQIINHFSRSLVRGELCAGDRIPSIRELSMALKVNTNTIQRAYQEMERDELIYSQRGLGYFIMENEAIADRVRQTMVSETLSRFLEDMRALGFSDAQIMNGIEQKIKEGGEQDAIDVN